MQFEVVCLIVTDESTPRCFSDIINQASDSYSCQRQYGFILAKVFLTEISRTLYLGNTFLIICENGMFG